MVVSDVNQSLGRVERSALVQTAWNNSPAVVGGLHWAQERYITVLSLWDVPNKHSLGLIWASGGQRSLEAPRGL